MITLIPAYGRKYDSSIEMLSDWNSGKDFKLRNGPYTSIRDIELLMKMSDEIEIVWLSKDGTNPQSLTVWKNPQPQGIY